MGLISALFGALPGIRSTAEVFVENKTKRAAMEHAEHIASLNQLGAEFAVARSGWFDRLIDGINRLPRPALALGTLGLFVYAMADPVSFGVRMQGLALVPEPLWWLLGAIVSFYFGARELHHFRRPGEAVTPGDVGAVIDRMREIREVAPEPVALPEPDPAPPLEPAPDGPHVPAPSGPDGNAALEEWRAQQR